MHEFDSLRMSGITPISLQHFLKFSAETIKRESMIESSPLGADGTEGNGCGLEGQTVQITVAGGDTEITPDVAEEANAEPGAKPKRKKKYKKKPPKPKKPKPGQVNRLFLYLCSIVTLLIRLFLVVQCLIQLRFF